MSQLANEQALLIGTAKSIMAIFTPGSPDKPVFVLINAGIIHRVGPNRLYVTLARALQRLGFGVLRFDLSGVGDSEGRADAASLLDAAMADIHDAVTWLEANRGVSQVVLGGLCSGADHSIIYAASDPRVVGVVLMDPTLPHTPRYFINLYRRKLARLRGAAGWSSAKARLRRMLSREPPPVLMTRPSPDANSDQARAFLTRVYGDTLARRAPIFAVLTAGLPVQHNYKEQLIDAFPTLKFGDRLELEYYKDCDHTFSGVRERSDLIRRILDWATRHFVVWLTPLAFLPPMM